MSKTSLECLWGNIIDHDPPKVHPALTAREILNNAIWKAEVGQPVADAIIAALEAQGMCIASREDVGWKDFAAQQCRNMDYYRGLVVEIGEMFGETAYISNDGSRQQDVLCAKVPDLVRAMIAARPK